MSDIGKYDELYLWSPNSSELIKMSSEEHHLEFLMSEYPDEEDYNEDFWDVVFEGGWIRIVLRKNDRGGYDYTSQGENLYLMKKILRDNFLCRLKVGENKVHIEEKTGSYMNPVHIFYLPQDKNKLFDFIFESKKLVPESLNEAQYFERGLNPKDSMGIGREAQIKKLDKETDWGFTVSPAFHTKTIDIIEYGGFLIKIMAVYGSDGVYSYMALNNTGEPYNNTPPLYNTPEEALDWEQKYIDQYNMDM